MNGRLFLAWFGLTALTCQAISAVTLIFFAGWPGLLIFAFGVWTPGAIRVTKTLVAVLKEEIA